MYLPDYPHHTSHAPPDLPAVQDLFAWGRMVNHQVTTIGDEGRLRAIKAAIRTGQRNAVAAIRAARLIDLGEIELIRLTPSGSEELGMPFGGEPIAYTFVTTAIKTNRLGRLLCVVAPRERVCSIFEIVPPQNSPSALWLSTDVRGEFFGAWPAAAGAFGGDGWATGLARLVALSKIERVTAPVNENRKRRARGLPPLPGHFKASLPLTHFPIVHPPGFGHHASPEPHLRRGYTRRLRDGRIVTVRACRVRGGPAGVATNLHSTGKEAL